MEAVKRWISSLFRSKNGARWDQNASIQGHPYQNGFGTGQGRSCKEQTRKDCVEKSKCRGKEIHESWKISAPRGPLEGNLKGNYRQMTDYADSEMVDALLEEVRALRTAVATLSTRVDSLLQSHCATLETLYQTIVSVRTRARILE